MFHILISSYTLRVDFDNYIDIVLARFLNAYPDNREILELLELPDNDLLDIVMGRSNSFQPHLKDLVARLRATTVAPLTRAA